MTELIQAPFRLLQVYVVQASFSHRVVPLSLPHTTLLPPQQIHVGIEMQNLNGGEASQVIVTISTNPDDGDERALYDFAVQIAGLVDTVDRVRFPDRELSQVLGAMIYPFAREAIANLTGRGRFGAVWINPFDISALVGKAMLAQAASDEEAERTAP